MLAVHDKRVIQLAAAYSPHLIHPCARLVPRASPLLRDRLGTKRTESAASSALPILPVRQFLAVLPNRHLAFTANGHRKRAANSRGAFAPLCKAYTRNFIRFHYANCCPLNRQALRQTAGAGTQHGRLTRCDLNKWRLVSANVEGPPFYTPYWSVAARNAVNKASVLAGTCRKCTVIHAARRAFVNLAIR